MIGTKLYWLVTEAHQRQQSAKSRYASSPRPGVEASTVRLRVHGTIYALRHRDVHDVLRLYITFIEQTKGTRRVWSLRQVRYGNSQLVVSFSL